MVAIKQQLVTSRAKTYEGVNGRKYITIHETANTSKGSDAQAHANLQTKGFGSSWHYSVDDKQVIQSFPHNVRCWHAGDGKGIGNYDSIGIEICVNSDGDFKKSVQNAAELVKRIMKQENISIQNVVQHNLWSGKNCPTNLRDGSKGINWTQFLDLVKKEEVKVANATRYSDVGKSHSSHDSLERIHSLDIIKGYTDGTYRPDEPLTRGQMAIVVDRLVTHLKK